MAEVSRLPGIRYRPDVVGGLGGVVSPPYDVIPAPELEVYRERSPYNVVRLIRPEPDYEAAGALFQTWLEAGVLSADGPSFYLHQVEYQLPGGDEVRRRQDLVARVRLHPYSDGVIVPHEKTHQGPKADRLALYRAAGAAFEPLWFLYSGEGTKLPSALACAYQQPAAAEFEFPAGERHWLWQITADEFGSTLGDAFQPLTLLIADGHHRYETALAYAEEVGGPPDHPSRFAMAILTDIADPGLLVLPTHRVMKAGVKVVGGEPVSSLSAALAAVSGPTAAVYRQGEFEVLHLEGDVAVEELHRQVIDNVLGRRNPEETLIYTRDAAEAVRWVDEGRGVAAFLLGRPDLPAIFAAARSGRQMPQKSTYFHPKPPSGMVFYRLAEEGKV